jgi:hypothetical protein
MIFFFDRSVAVTIANIVKALEGGNVVVYHDDRFAKNTADTAWIAAVAQWNPKPVVISGDTRILERPDEAAALSKSNLMFFCLAPGWTNLDLREYPWKFLKAWNNMRDTLKITNEPAIFKVAVGSSLKVDKVCLTKTLRKK